MLKFSFKILFRIVTKSSPTLVVIIYTKTVHYRKSLCSEIFSISSCHVNLHKVMIFQDFIRFLQLLTETKLRRYQQSTVQVTMFYLFKRLLWLSTDSFQKLVKFVPPLFYPSQISKAFNTKWACHWGSFSVNFISAWAFSPCKSLLKFCRDFLRV